MKKFRLVTFLLLSILLVIKIIYSKINWNDNFSILENKKVVGGKYYFYYPIKGKKQVTYEIYKKYNVGDTIIHKVK